MKYDVVVMGSINMDLMVHVDTFPEYLQNSIATGFEMLTGGKGANQAVAVARQGVTSAFVGAVGDDDFGNKLEAGLQSAGVDTSHLLHRQDVATGMGMGIVDRHGENTFIGVLGANMALTGEEISREFEQIEARVLLVQMETSKESVLVALRCARERGMRVVLDPAPEGCFFPEALAYADIVTPNRQETERITGMQVTDVDEAKRAAYRIAQMGVPQVVVKLGGEGSVLYKADRDEYTVFEASTVDVVNTTGAGDTFAGVLAACLSRDGQEIDEALTLATCAAGYKVSHDGGQQAIPTWDQLQEAVRS